MEAVLVHSSAPASSLSLAPLPGCPELLEPSSAFFARIPLRHSLPPHSHHQRGVFLVRAAKGRRRYGPGAPQQRNAPIIPKLDDDDNPKFVIFIRDKRVPLWFPLNIVSGGTLAKMVVAAMGNEFGKKMSQSTLTRDLGNAIYKDEKSIRISAIKKYSMLKSATSFEYGYKLVDKDNLKAALTTSNITKIPPQEELKSVVDKVKDFFGQGVSGLKDSFGSMSGVNSGVEEEASKLSKKDSNSN